MSPTGSLAVLVLHAVVTHREACLHGRTVSLQWLPGHLNVQGNDDADRAVKLAHGYAQTYLVPFCRADAHSFPQTLRHDEAACLWYTDLQNTKTSLK